MKTIDLFVNLNNAAAKKKAQEWANFLDKNDFQISAIEKIDFQTEIPVVTDKKKNKFSIDFVSDTKNYHKTKLSIKNELLSKALGGGKAGLKVLDLSAGLAVDSIFLAQLGYAVTAVERNPLIYLCLKQALEVLLELQPENEAAQRISFHFAEASDFLDKTKDSYDVVYFDPMFPEKNKSALPRQEMVFFKGMVGADDDAVLVLEKALKLKGIKRVAVKRPLKAPVLGLKPVGSVQGKLIRFDIYGVKS